MRKGRHRFAAFKDSSGWPAGAEFIRFKFGATLALNVK
jgi:hypothetical protein